MLLEGEKYISLCVYINILTQTDRAVNYKWKKKEKQNGHFSLLLTWDPEQTSCQVHKYYIQHCADNSLLWGSGI